jgi:uncharacterized integral membrane protein
VTGDSDPDEELLRREGHAPDSAPHSDVAAESVGEDGTQAVSSTVPRTRVGLAWVGVCMAALVAVALIVFMTQNTRRVQISFLWMSTETPLAIALLIASVGSVIVTLILGTARILQLRHHIHKKPGSGPGSSAQGRG